MKLQTIIPLSKQPDNLIDYKSNILLLGSCFSENIGNKLTYFKFKSFQNPFGILFHSKAIEALVVNAINGKRYTEEDIFFHNEQWHCFDAHSRLSNPSKEGLINSLNNQIDLLSQHIKTGTHLIITLGTAWVYRFKEKKSVVANCHKVHQKHFEKELLSVETITHALKNISDLIKGVNPMACVIFTVSPIRHLKDGFVENMQSKAHLISAIHKLLESEKSSTNLYYFPSYEIIMDELRDYRFYDSDMIHPNQLAIDYIWERFKEVWFAQSTLKDMDEVETIQKGLLHKPFNPNSNAHNAFLEALQGKIDKLQVRFPHIVF